MKTEMNPDLEFLRGLRESLNMESKKLNLDSDIHEMRGKLFHADRADAEADRCEKISNQITDYLKTRGIE